MLAIAVSHTGNAYILGRKNSCCNNKAVHTVGPVVHSPSVNYFFGGGLHADGNDFLEQLFQVTCIDHYQQYYAYNNTVNAEQFKSMLL